jgi:hypothetical protein
MFFFVRPVIQAFSSISQQMGKTVLMSVKVEVVKFARQAFQLHGQRS